MLWIQSICFGIPLLLPCADFIKGGSVVVAANSVSGNTVSAFDPPGDVLDRTCSLCGRGQTELQQAGHSLRFLCPDEVCTECIDDDVAAA